MMKKSKTTSYADRVKVTLVDRLKASSRNRDDWWNADGRCRTATVKRHDKLRRYFMRAIGCERLFKPRVR